MTLRSPSSLAALAALALLACAPAACSSGDEEPSSVASEINRATARDLPWEVSSPEGESVVPNVFYAEASENEQIMPLTVDGRHVVDRLIYPTIGNPNLFVRSEKDESFLTVMRLEKELLAHLSPRLTGGGNLMRLELTETDRDRLAFYLVERSARDAATDSNGAVVPGRGVIAIRPSALLVHAVPDDMPEPFKARWTVRALFDRTAMKDVPDGLYDVRMEVVRNGAIASAPNGAAAYEAHYNALRVFDRPLASIVNVTDTQVSVGNSFETKTLAKLREFVARVNTTTDPSVRDAAFITFNGDLHNSGSPETVSPSAVASTYRKEAEAILATLKELRLPIFLTLGNHDGYASIGHAPALFRSRIADFFGQSLHDAVDDVGPHTEWPGFAWDDYQRFLDETKLQMGGKHVDVFSGAHMRRPGTNFGRAWVPVARAERNMVLYDGVYQWQRTYGPTYASWHYGKTRFVNLDSYDLRQHRRTGWGLYTVNYGGGLSKVQLEWAKRELDRAETLSDDVVLVAHHDPRGGHKGKDYPFLFDQVDYTGIDQSFSNYFDAEVFGKAFCKLAPAWARSDEQEASCLHDGLQEWMRPDVDFDHEADGSPWYSNFEMISAIYTHPRVRTVLLGHTHYNSLEVFGAGDPLVPPNAARLDAKITASYDVENPLRGHSRPDRPEVEEAVAAAANALGELDRAASQLKGRGLDGAGRELVILRLTSNADLTDQKQAGRAMYGFATLGLSKRAGYDAPQINDVTFFINDGRGSFEAVRHLALDRTRRVGNAATDATNPLRGLFQGFGE
jgi:hypothetical protein